MAANPVRLIIDGPTIHKRRSSVRSLIATGIAVLAFPGLALAAEPGAGGEWLGPVAGLPARGELAERFSLNSAQVRKDLAYFGEFGVRGIGYYVAGLKAELQRILGLDREWSVALVGLGNLGSALFHYKGFARQGFRIAVVIDDDPAKIGREIESVPIVGSRDMAREIKARAVQIAIVAVPPEAAQTVTEQL